MTSRLLVILGATATGKTRLAVASAHLLSGEIISADSRQVYRGMDIGTGKDLAEYGSIPLHLVDVAAPGDEFSLFEFLRRYAAACSGILSRGKLPILAGGTGLYLDAVIRGYRLAAVPENPAFRSQAAGLSDEELAERLRALRPGQHNTTDLLHRERLIRALEIALCGDAEPVPLPPVSPVVFGIRRDRQELRKQITIRLEERLRHGMIEEVEALVRSGISFETLDFYGLEYRYVALYIRGVLTRNDMFQKLNSAIHDFAKRQENWFRRMERHGVHISWLDGGRPTAELARELSDRFLAT